MRWLAAILIASFFVVHDGARWLAAHSSFTAGDTHYMLQGLGGAILATCLMIFFIASKPSYWRTLSIGVLAFWIIEQLEIVSCRLAVDDLSKVPDGMGLCTYATGFPMGTALTWIEGLFVVAALGAGVGQYLFGWWRED